MRFWMVMRILQAIAGAALLILAWQSGRTQALLVTTGVQASGVIVDYEMQRFTRTLHNRERTRSKRMPVVEFETEGRVVRFTDWLGSSSPSSLGAQVRVLHSRENPSVAMIDRRFGNWLPWSAFFILGMILIGSALRGKREQTSH